MITMEMLILTTFVGYTIGYTRAIDYVCNYVRTSFNDILHPPYRGVVFLGWNFARAAKRHNCRMEDLVWNGEELVPDYNKPVRPYQPVIYDIEGIESLMTGEEG